MLFIPFKHKAIHRAQQRKKSHLQTSKGQSLKDNFNQRRKKAYLAGTSKNGRVLINKLSRGVRLLACRCLAGVGLYPGVQTQYLSGWESEHPSHYSTTPFSLNIFYILGLQ